MRKPKEYTSLFRSMSGEWKWLLRYVSRYRKEIFLYVVIGLLGIGMGLGSTVASKYLIDAVVSHSNETIAVTIECDGKTPEECVDLIV